MTATTAAGGAPRRLPAGSVRKVVLGVGLPIVVLILWQILASTDILNPVLFPAPTTIFGTLDDRIRSGELVRDLYATLSEVVTGYIISLIIGLPLGVAVGLWRRVDYSVEPFVIGVYTAPTIALYPLMILFLGIGFATIVLLTVLFAVIPIIINTALGVRLVDPVTVRSAVSFGATRRELMRHVILPGSLPSIATGLELAVGRAITGAVVAELFVGSVGLGYSIGYYSSFLRLDAVFLYIFILGILGFLLRELMTALERRVRYESR